MRADTQTVTLDAAPDRVFGFLADPANLPRWAIHFARAVRPNADGSWTVAGEEGEIAVRVKADRATGVVDWLLAPAPGVEALAASRVLPNGAGSALVFTQFQLPGVPDAAFEKLVRDLREELAELRRALGPAGAPEAPAGSELAVAPFPAGPTPGPAFEKLVGDLRPPSRPSW